MVQLLFGKEGGGEEGEKGGEEEGGDGDVVMGEGGGKKEALKVVRKHFCHFQDARYLSGVLRLMGCFAFAPSTPSSSFPSPKFPYKELLEDNYEQLAHQFQISFRVLCSLPPSSPLKVCVDAGDQGKWGKIKGREKKK